MRDAWVLEFLWLSLHFPMEAIFALSLFRLVESWTVTLTPADEACRTSDVVLGSSGPPG